MRAMEPCRSWMRSGLGSLSRILDWSVEGPRGAKLVGEVGEDEAVGDDGRDGPLPSPGTLVSFHCFVTALPRAYLRGTRPAANRLVSRSPCWRYLIVCARGCVGRLGGAYVLRVAVSLRCVGDVCG
jgi:hypothetical protein